MEKSKEAYRIFETVFSSGMSESTFLHKHYDNPAKIEEPIRIYMEDGQPAGTNAFMGTYLWENGKRHYLTQSNDTAVLPTFRGKGIFTKIITAQETSDAQSEFIFGLPNSNSYPGFIKMGWTKKCDFTHYIKMCNPFGILLGHRIIVKPISKLSKFITRYHHVKLSQSETIDCQTQADFSDKDIQTINANIQVGFERSNEFYQWKLLNYKEEAQFVILRDNQELEGYVLFHQKKRGRGISAQIDDFYVNYKSEEATIVMKKLLNEIMKSADMIDNPLINNDSEDARIFKNLNLKDYSKVKKDYVPQVMLVSPRGKDASYMEYCQMRYIDFDVFLNKEK